MKIYTKTGDQGTTALYGGTRVSKHHIRIESYGTLDELNAHIGLLRDQAIAPDYRSVLAEIQDRLFTAGAIMATPPDKERLKNGALRLQIDRITAEDIAILEQEIDQMESTLPVMTHFILPGGHTIVSFCHIARCVCRRAERLAVHLHELEPIEEAVLHYLNRLSDYLFVLARKLSSDLQAEEVKWIPRQSQTESET
jgi:cob(I)alamin adenosyltransferase